MSPNAGQISDSKTMTNTTAVSAPATSTSRLIALDVLRGITIAFMIMVNNNGDGAHAYWAMKHAAWNGFTPTDLVFPTFLFLVGTSIVFSFESRLSKGVSRTSLFLHTLRRAAVLFLFGLVVNGFPFFHLSTLRIYGVLQRIAICFLCASVLYLWDRRAASKVAIVIACLLGYWILMRWVPVPGFGVPGRDVPLLDKDANLVAWLDRHIFPGRLYEGTRDPEGLLSDLPAMGTILLGVLTGIWLRSTRALQQKFQGMLGAAFSFLVIAAIWNHWFPINKKMWTSSYVLFAAGWTLLAFAICYWAVEIKGWKRGWTGLPLVFGMNAITAYIFSELLASVLYTVRVPSGAVPMDLQRFLFTKIFAPIGNLAFASLLYSIAFALFCAIPVAILYRKKIFLKI
jgi:predicted acyltransferase